MITHLDHLAALAKTRELLAAARQSVAILMYMIRPPRHNEAGPYADYFADLLAAAARGLPCRAILNDFPQGHQSAPYNKLAGRLMLAAGWRLRIPPPNHIEHSKLYIIDTAYIICGSSNAAFDNRRTTTNANIYHDDPSGVHAAANVFEQAWAHARPFL